jgi:hypothetical protein
VVTVHATPSAVVVVREMGERVPAHTTVVTDLAHSQWILRHIDRHFAPAAEEVK